MQLLKPVLSGSLFLFLNIIATTQNKIYFKAGSRNGETASTTASATIYRPVKKNTLPIITRIEKIILLFNKSGHFIQSPPLYREKDELNMVCNGHLDDYKSAEDNKYVYLIQPANKVAKKIIAAILYKDGRRILYAPR